MPKCGLAGNIALKFQKAIDWNFKKAKTDRAHGLIHHDRQKKSYEI